jgi:hypothetical protein
VTGPAVECSEGRFAAARNIAVQLGQEIVDTGTESPRLRGLLATAASQELTAEVAHILDVVRQVIDIASQTGETVGAAWDRLERTGGPPAPG